MAVSAARLLSTGDCRTGRLCILLTPVTVFTQLLIHTYLAIVDVFPKKQMLPSNSTCTKQAAKKIAAAFDRGNTVHVHKQFPAF